MITQEEAEELAKMVAELAHCQTCGDNFCNALSVIFFPIRFVHMVEDDPDDAENSIVNVAVAVTDEFAIQHGWRAGGKVN
jgi:hypothetical protein